jgi:uncharacterized protein YjbI with pentapeptide repeats
VNLLATQKHRWAVLALLLVVACALVYGISVNKGFFRGAKPISEVDIQNYTSAPNSRSSWEHLNKEALRLYREGSPSGAEFLGRMLRWNLSYRRGVDLAGVKLRDVFAVIPTQKRLNLLELAESGGAIGSIISFANCTINETEHPQTPLYGANFDGSTFSQEDLTKWFKARSGNGMVGVSLVGVDLSWLDQRGVFFNGANLSHSGLRPAIWIPSETPVWVDRRFERCVMDGLEFEGGDLSGMSLRFADLRGSKMTPQQLLEVGKSDGGRGIVGAKLPAVDLRGLDISGISFYSVDLGGCILDQRQLDTIETSK